MITVCFGILVLIYSCAKGIEPGCESCGCCANKECRRGYVHGHYVDDYCTRGCIAGYGGNKCYNKCANDCVTCDQHYPQYCTTCDERKYINEDRRCIDCPNNCKQCTSATQCQECYFPYNNDDPKQDCSLSCPGNCVCENLGVCSSCQDGFYNVSNTCRNECPDTCKTCTDQSHCQSCKPSYSGDICCINDGHCNKCSSSTVCNKCTDGYYGINCDVSCPQNCHNSRCDRDKGICLGCEEGFHSDYCTKNCSEGCWNNRCTQENGHCSEGCKDGLYGDHCDRNCSKRCLNNRCSQEHGHCSNGCENGLFGDYCDRNCSERCITKLCMQENGSCIDGCTPGFEGPTCSQKLHEDRASSEIGTMVGIGIVILVVIVTVLIVVTIILVKRWKTNFLRKYSDTTNCASYVNTQLQTTYIDAVNVCVNKDPSEQSGYERLDERNDRRCNEYDQIESVNQ